jgi:hypothetical protein
MSHGERHALTRVDSPKALFLLERLDSATNHIPPS